MTEKKVVICGGGIIGCSTAYFLTQLGQVDLTIVERHEIAGQASGKAGGFLALDWNDGGPVGALARRSFELHDQLSRDLAPRDIGYRRMKTYSVTAHESDDSSNPPPEALPQWIDAKVRGVESLGSRDTTAQVHPHKLTSAFVDAAKAKGAKVIKGAVERIVYDKHGEDQQVSGVVVNGETIQADIVVIALGPWSGIAAKFFPGSGLPEITGTRAHSIIMDVKEGRIGAEAIFLSYVDSQKKMKDPEIYPREDGTVYVCGESDNVPLPDDPADVTFDEGKCSKLESISNHMSATIKKNGNIMHRQACYLPCSPDGNPLIGKIPKYSGAYIATGHSCWGILNGPATGESLAQMILGLEPSVNLDKLSPGRFQKRK